ncbi:MAG: hypothetical protein O3A55_07870 [Bacteroidetes bacterium]|nr:hypothetical protein [Bacteroidota bacterium]
MELTIFFAQFWGILLIIMGLEFLLKKSVLDDLFKMTEDKSFMIISGYLALILGLVTVILHNIWVADWRVVITIFGWLSLMKGIARIGFPEIAQKYIKALEKQQALIKIWLVIVVVLGTWLTWMGFN